MATSKNKRKNGKVRKHDPVKRMRTMAAYDLQNLMVCNVVDRIELESEERSEMIPRTCVFNRKTKTITPITKSQEQALKTERWFWNIQMGIVCRRQDGEVYLDKETNAQLGTEVLLTEMNDYVTDKLTELWGKVNSLHALTMYWVASPYKMGEDDAIPLEAVLAPLWKYNVLGNMLTQYEQENDNVQVVHYRTDNFEEFGVWFVSQQRYRNELNNPRTLTYWFEPSGIKMKKGELMAWREDLIKKGKIEQVGFDYEKFNPVATPNGFKAWGKHTATMNGYDSSVLMGAFDNVPACLEVYVEITKNGETAKIKLFKDEIGRDVEYL